MHFPCFGAFVLKKIAMLLFFSGPAVNNFLYFWHYSYKAAEGSGFTSHHLRGEMVLLLTWQTDGWKLTLLNVAHRLLDNSLLSLSAGDFKSTIKGLSSFIDCFPWQRRRSSSWKQESESSVLGYLKQPSEGFLRCFLKWTEELPGRWRKSIEETSAQLQLSFTEARVFK